MFECSTHVVDIIENWFYDLNKRETDLTIKTIFNDTWLLPELVKTADPLSRVLGSIGKPKSFTIRPCLTLDTQIVAFIDVSPPYISFYYLNTMQTANETATVQSVRPVTQTIVRLPRDLVAQQVYLQEENSYEIPTMRYDSGTYDDVDAGCYASIDLEYSNQMVLESYESSYELYWIKHNSRPAFAGPLSSWVPQKFHD